MPTISTEIERVSKEVEDFKRRLVSAEEELQRLSERSERRRIVLDSITEIKYQIEEHEKQLSHLRRENRKTMLVSVSIFSLFALCYVIYSTLTT